MPVCRKYSNNRRCCVRDHCRAYSRALKCASPTNAGTSATNSSTISDGAYATSPAAKLMIVISVWTCPNTCPITPSP